MHVRCFSNAYLSDATAWWELLFLCTGAPQINVWISVHMCVCMWCVCVRVCAGRGQCLCVVRPGDCSNQMGVLIRVCSSVAWWGAMRAADCNAMLQSVPLTTTETNRQENHYHAVHFFPLPTFGTPQQCKQTSKTRHTSICMQVCHQLNYYNAGCFHSSGHNEALWHDWVIYHYLGVSVTPIE